MGHEGFQWFLIRWVKIRVQWQTESLRIKGQVSQSLSIQNFKILCFRGQGKRAPLLQRAEVLRMGERLPGLLSELAGMTFSLSSPSLATKRLQSWQHTQIIMSGQVWHKGAELQQRGKPPGFGWFIAMAAEGQAQLWNQSWNKLWINVFCLYSLI